MAASLTKFLLAALLPAVARPLERFRAELDDSVEEDRFAKDLLADRGGQACEAEWLVLECLENVSCDPILAPFGTYLFSVFAFES